MMNRKYIAYIVLSLVLVFASTMLSAQNDNKQLFKEVQEQLFLKDRATKIAFTSTVFNAEGEELGEIKGYIYLQGENFRLEYKPIVAVYRKGLLAYHDSENATFTLSEPSAEELIQINPLYFLRSQAKGFKIERLPETKSNLMLGFTPPTEDMNIRKLRVAISRRTKAVREIKIEATDGAFFILKVNAQEYVPAQADSFYELKKKDFPKSEFVDLR